LEVQANFAFCRNRHRRTPGRPEGFRMGFAHALPIPRTALPFSPCGRRKSAPKML
jgi:hypothetical protein